MMLGLLGFGAFDWMSDYDDACDDGRYNNHEEMQGHDMG
jgi:hypothetical protein